MLPPTCREGDACACCEKPERVASLDLGARCSTGKKTSEKKGHAPFRATPLGRLCVQEARRRISSGNLPVYHIVGSRAKSALLQHVMYWMRWARVASVPFRCPLPASRSPTPVCKCGSMQFDLYAGAGPLQPRAKLRSLQCSAA